MKVTIIPIVIGALGTVTKGSLKGVEDLEVKERMETIQITKLLRSARILRVLETWEDWKTIGENWYKTLFLLTITRSGHLVKIRWSVCISKSHRVLCVSFSWMVSGLCISLLVIRLNLLFTPWEFFTSVLLLLLLFVWTQLYGFR